MAESLSAFQEHPDAQNAALPQAASQLSLDGGKTASTASLPSNSRATSLNQPSIALPQHQTGSSTSLQSARPASTATAPVVPQAPASTASASASASASAPAILRRKLTSFVGFSNLPQQWHQKSIRQGFDFNLLVVGDSGLGKSTLLNTLFEVPVHDLDTPQQYDGATLGIQTTKIELEESGVKLRLSVIDTPGYGDHVNNMDSWKPIVEEVDTRFEQYLEAEEALSVGAAGSVHDPRVHACLFFLEPTGHSMKPLDVAVIKKLHQKVNIVPVIAKADTQTDEELADFKNRVLADIRAQGIEIFEPLVYQNEDEESAAELAELKAKIPFAIVGSTQLVVNRDGRQVLGREYPWGVVEVHNEEHNDFVKLRSLLIRNHMEDLRERTERLYEAYRSEKLLALGVKQDDSVFEVPDPAVRQEEERRQHEQRLAKMESEMRAVFQQKVTEKEAKLKSSEAELFQKHREIKEQLDRQRAELEQRKQQLQMQIDQKRRVR